MNPNNIGDFLFIFTPILITSGFYFRPVKGLRFVFLAVVLLALFFTFARTSWLAALVSISFLLWKSGRYKCALAASFVALLVLAGMTVPLWREPLYDFVAGPRYTGRQELWRAAWNVACDYPVLGTGPGNCQKFMNPYIDVQWLQNQNTHNTYLRNAAEMGFLGAVLLLTFYAIFFYYSWSIEKNLKSNYLRLAVRGTIATYLGMFVHDMFQNGSMLTCFSAAEAHIMFPYILLAFPFAAKKLDQRPKPA
jgi:O-antigen ligase